MKEKTKANENMKYYSKEVLKLVMMAVTVMLSSSAIMSVLYFEEIEMFLDLAIYMSNTTVPIIICFCILLAMIKRVVGDIIESPIYSLIMHIAVMMITNIIIVTVTKIVFSGEQELAKIEIYQNIGIFCIVLVLVFWVLGCIKGMKGESPLVQKNK